MRITTKGIGAHDHDLELQRLTLMVGPNGSGKSKLAEAIRMVALGYVPALGKRPVDLAALMQGETMSVELSLEGGRTIRRTLDRKGQGYTASAEASWMRQASRDEASKAITKLFGDEEQDVAEMLDIRQLLAATPNQRAARMEQLLSAGARSGEDIARDVARLIVMRLAETTEDRMPEDYRDALPMVPDKQKEILFEQAEMIKTKILEAGIQGAVTWANAEKRDASEGLKRKNAAADELRKRAAQVPEPDERDIIRLEGEKNKTLQELGAARQRTKEYREKAATIEGLKAQLEATEEHALRTDQVAQDAEGVNGKAAAELRERCDKVLEAMASLKLPPEEDDAQARKLDEAAKEISRRSDAIEVPEVHDTSAAEERVDDLKKRLKSAEASPWSEVLTIAQNIEDVATTKGIKTAVAKPLKRLRELSRASMGANLEEIKHELDRALAQFTEQTETADKATAARQLALARRIELKKEFGDKQAEAIRLRAGINNRRKEAIGVFDAKRAELSVQRQNLEKGIETHRKALEGARAEKAMVDRRLASLRDQLHGAGELPATPPAPEATEARIRDIEVELQKLIAARATHTEIQTVLGEIEAAKAAAVVFTAIEWALQRQREIEISNAGGPLMRTMTEFLKAAGRKETPYVRATQGNCAIGWKTADGREIQIQVLSGGEWCLFASALTAAVILCRRSTVKILLVEAGETDARILGQLLAGISGMCGEESLSAIVMSPRPPEVLDPAWTMYRIYQDQEAASAAA